MKGLVFILLLVCMGTSQALAQGAGIGAFGSYWDSKDVDDAIGGGALLRFEPDPAFQMDLRGSYFEFDDQVGGGKADLTVIPVEAALMFKPIVERGYEIYVGGGVGYYFADADVIIPGGTIDLDFDDEFGYFALAGLQFNVNPNFSLFAEVKYTWLEFEEAKISSKEFRELGSERIDIDLKMDGIGFNAGLLLLF